MVPYCTGYLLHNKRVGTLGSSISTILSYLDDISILDMLVYKSKQVIIIVHTQTILNIYPLFNQQLSTFPWLRPIQA